MTTKQEPIDIRQPLAEYFRGEAHWRELKGEAHPEDEDRNLASAHWLGKMAEHVLTLDPADPRLVQIGAAHNWCIDDVLTFGEEASRFASRIGFSGHEPDLDQTLTHFAEACANDAVVETDLEP
jgi:hypothetical protein